MKTAKINFKLNEPTNWNVSYYGWHKEGKRTPTGIVAHKNCYGTNERMRFTRPSYNCFYMRVLRQLNELSAQDAYQLGCKEKKDGKIVRHNTGILGAMRKAGLINYCRIADAWYITKTGKKYYAAAIEALKNN